MVKNNRVTFNGDRNLPDLDDREGLLMTNGPRKLIGTIVPCSGGN
jgi:hypothetical protein